MNDLVILDMVATGKKIKQAMANRNMSVSQLQIRMQMASATNIYKWLRGEISPSLEKFVQLGQILEMPLDELVAVEGEHGNNT